MPFSQSTGTPFNRTSVEQISPTIRGIYGLFRPGIWIYVGKGDVRDRLLRHLNGDNACITREAPTHFVFEEAPLTLDTRERELILELDPICNERVG